MDPTRARWLLGGQAATDADHNASLTAIVQLFGDVMFVDEALEALDAAASPDAAGSTDTMAESGKEEPVAAPTPEEDAAFRRRLVQYTLTNVNVVGMKVIRLGISSLAPFIVASAGLSAEEEAMLLSAFFPGYLLAVVFASASFLEGVQSDDPAQRMAGRRLAHSLTHSLTHSLPPSLRATSQVRHLAAGDGSRGADAGLAGRPRRWPGCHRRAVLGGAHAVEAAQPGAGAGGDALRHGRRAGADGARLQPAQPQLDAAGQHRAGVGAQSVRGRSPARPPARPPKGRRRSDRRAAKEGRGR